MQPGMQQPQTDQWGQPAAQQPGMMAQQPGMMAQQPGMMAQQPGMMAQPMMMNPNAKSKLVAALIGIFLGELGIHNFYLGNNGKGAIQLILTLTLIGWLISKPWSFIEAIMILTGAISHDANGLPLKEGF